MDFDKQKKILQRLNEEYNRDVLNFNKFIGFEINNNDIFNTYSNQYFNYQSESNQSESNQTNSSELDYPELKFNFKRKHLLKIIHPDKINYLINSEIQNINKSTFDTNKQLLANCVSNILSNNLNLVESLIWVPENGHLIDEIISVVMKINPLYKMK